MSNPDPQQLFRESLGRCRECGDFLDRFYDRFMDSSEEVREKFINTDFTRQKKKLLESLTLAADVVDGDASAMRHLHERAESHSRHELNIEPPLYTFWLDSLLATAEGCDSQWDNATRSAWETVLGHIIAYMQLHY